MLKMVDLVSDLPHPQAKDFVVYPWLQPGRLTLMVGPTDIGKTTLTLEILAACLSGTHLWDRYPTKKIERVLYLHGEHTLETVREAATARGDIPKEAVMVIHDFGHYGAALLEGGRPTQLVKELFKLTEEFKPQLIIAEPVTAFLSTSENDNLEARKLVNLLASLGARYAAPVLTHHHVGKAHWDPEKAKPEGVPAGEARGAMAFEDASERVIYLKRVGKVDDRRIRLETPKSKGFPISSATLIFNGDTLTYHYCPLPLAERDVIAVYDRTRKFPNESITSLIEHFMKVWNCSPNLVSAIIKRARKVGLLPPE